MPFQLSFLPPPIVRPSASRRFTIKDKSDRDFVRESRMLVQNDVDEDDSDRNPTGERFIPSGPVAWTSWDDIHIRDFWGKHPVGEIARSIPCSDDDLICHAADIGLVYVPCSCPACTTVSMFAELDARPCIRKAA